MIFRAYYLPCLAQASYLIASGGVAAVIDPQRDVDCYIEDACELALRIDYVIETHLHADFVSGHRELAERTGAKIVIGARAGAAFPHVPARDGDEIAFGDCLLRILETPGHTMESISIVVCDRNANNTPRKVFTGDTLFVGDVGRPDLGGDRSPRELAGRMYDSLHQKLLVLPDEVEVHPAHGAGSLCGRAMRAERSSTIGVERTTNAALGAKDREEFITLLTRDLPVRPAYFERDVELNRKGGKALKDLPALLPLSPGEIVGLQMLGTIVLDVRSSADFGEGHVPGSINIGLDGQFAAWAGTVVGLDASLVLVCDDPLRVREAQLRLARVGIENVEGYLKDGMPAWKTTGLQLARLPQIEVDDLYTALNAGGVRQLIDVRRPAEWNSGAIAGSVQIPLDSFADRMWQIDPCASTAVYCKAGYRSSIAASLMLQNGFKDVINVSGGYDAWVQKGHANGKVSLH